MTDKAWVNFYNSTTGLPALIVHAGFWPQVPAVGDRVFVAAHNGEDGGDELWEITQRTWYTPTTAQVFVSRCWAGEKDA